MHFALFEVFLFVGWPLRIAHRLLVTQSRPQLFGNVRSERCEGNHQLREQLFIGAMGLRQFVYAYHKGCHGRVIREGGDVGRHFLQQFVNRFKLFCRCLGIVRHKLARAQVVEQTPELLQKAVTTINSVGVPRLTLLHRTKEHLVKTQRIGPVVLNDEVGVYHVVHTLRHLFYGPTAHILVVFEHKLGILIFGSPCAEGLNVQHITMNDVHIHVYGRNLVLVFQSQRHEERCLITLAFGSLHTINKVTAALNHTLINQLLERLIVYGHAQVEEELVPEPTIYKVSCGVFRSAHIEINVLPIANGRVAHQRIVVVRVHIAQEIGRRAGETRHGVQL